MPRPNVAFVGGSLVPVGGHNLLEPAVLHRPILVGPHKFNAADIAQDFSSAEPRCKLSPPPSSALPCWIC